MFNVLYLLQSLKQHYIIYFPHILSMNEIWADFFNEDKSIQHRLLHVNVSPSNSFFRITNKPFKGIALNSFYIPEQIVVLKMYCISFPFEIFALYNR
jgi:hypothetical protein